jgi:TPR repeat protein/serine/threonine protein kinase
MKHCPQCSTGYPDTLAACPAHGLPLNEIRDLKPGMVVHHSYRIVRKLGQGGMGAVYLAQHTLMDEPRALKFLSTELSNDEAFTRRFLREVRTLRQLRHSNVVDCGDLESAEDGSLFFSMEFVDGPDLRDFLRDASFQTAENQGFVTGHDFSRAEMPQNTDGVLTPAGALPVELALALTRQIAAGLAAAHARGMVHRDIKPENILLAHDATGWQPKIADFGIVATKESSSVFTRTGGTLLTVAYAAPEQWRGTPAAQLDGRTDLYALGGLLYEMLTGQTPFHAESYEGWAQAHQTTPPPPPSALRPDLANWQGLDSLVKRLLAKDRQDRPKDVAELICLLDAINYLPSDMLQETILEDTEKQAKVKIHRKMVRWLLLLSVSVITLAIVIAGFAFSWPTSIIAKRADDFDRSNHYNLGGILRNLACKRGNGNACFVLGVTFDIGRGVVKDNSRAAMLYSESCDAGYGDGCTSLGEMYFEGNGVGRDYSLAANYYTNACDKGDSLGCSSVANMYYDGKFVQEDDFKAKEFYAKGLSIDSKKCDAGDSFWCGFVAYEYENGIDGIVKDTEKARQFYSKSCSLGEKHSCDDLRRLDANEPKPMQVVNPKNPAQQSGFAEIEQQATAFYMQGRYSEARPLFEQSCAVGHWDSCDILTIMYIGGLGGLPQGSSMAGKPFSEAVPVFERTCANGHADACSHLGWMYKNGIGVPEDWSQFFSYSSKACDGGDGFSCLNVGVEYEVGGGIKQDYSRAAVIYSKSCNAGNALGCQDLGSLYHRGLGVAQDDSRAGELFSKACKLGAAVGCTELKNMNKKR